MFCILHLLKSDSTFAFHHLHKGKNNILWDDILQTVKVTFGEFMPFHILDKILSLKSSSLSERDCSNLTACLSIISFH